MTQSLLQNFTPPPPGSPTLISFYPLWRIYPLTLTTFYPCWQPSSNLIIPLWTIDNWPTHSYDILPPSPLAAQLHFTPADQFTHSHLQYFTSLGSPVLNSLYPLWAIDPLTLKTFYPLPLGSPAPFYSRWLIYSLTLTIFYLPWQPSSYLILPPLNKLPPHTYNILPPLATQLYSHFTTSEQFTHSHLQHFTPLATQL